MSQIDFYTKKISQTRKPIQHGHSILSCLLLFHQIIIDDIQQKHESLLISDTCRQKNVTKMLGHRNKTKIQQTKAKHKTQKKNNKQTRHTIVFAGIHVTHQKKNCIQN